MKCTMNEIEEIRFSPALEARVRRLENCRHEGAPAHVQEQEIEELLRRCAATLGVTPEQASNAERKLLKAIFEVS